nr:MAG TPA: hypothetical protein [Caudoviricetes sp.]
MKRIVRGNDFTMRIPVVKIVDGEKVAFPLPGCTDIVVRLCSAYRRLELAHTIDAKEDNVIVARVEGDRIPFGTYALEVRGKIFGNDWRSNEYEQVAIVDRNADADTELGNTDEGEDSVEMDTAVVILPPDRELDALVKETLAQNKAMSELSDAIKASEEGRTKSEELRAKSEEARQEAEKTRASNEAERTKAEQVRESSEGQRLAAEQGRASAESARVTAESARVDAENARVEAEAARVTAENARTEAEAARQEAEKKREASEVTRTRTETERETNEQARQEAETVRKEAESVRKEAETVRKEAETVRKEAESEREAQEQARVKNEEGRVKSENARAQAEAARVTAEAARVKAEAKRAEDIGQAVSKANAASEVAVTANEPFVWEPFKDLEHWNITAMDLATGTVTLDTEEHGLAVGDLVTLAVNITEWSGIYKIGRQWDSALGEKRIVNFPVKDHSAIPVVAVTAVNGAEVQCDRLKKTTDYQVTPSDWQLQRAATGSKMVDLPDRYIGKPVTITIESQYTNHIIDWAHYNSELLLVDSKGSPVAFCLGDGVCGVPIFKTVCSIRSGYVSRVDIGNQVYKEKLSIGLPYQATTCASKNGHFDVRQGKALRISKVLGHYAARVIVEPYRELTELGGVNSEDSERKRQLAELIEKQKLQFGVDLVDSNEYTVPETDIQTTNFNIVDQKTITTLLAELQCAFTPQDDLYVVIGGQDKFVFGQKGGRLVITSKDAFEGANEYTDLEDMGAAADGEYHRYRLYVDGGDEGKVTLDVDGVRVKEIDYVTGKVISNAGSAYGCMGFLGQSIKWGMSYRPPMGVKLKGLQTIVTADANKSKLVSFAPCAGTNWLAYFDTNWYPQMNGANFCSFRKWPSLANGYNVQSTAHVPWLGAVLTNGDRAWVGCAGDKWAQVAP